MIWPAHWKDFAPNTIKKALVTASNIFRCWHFNSQCSDYLLPSYTIIGTFKCVIVKCELTHKENDLLLSYHQTRRPFSLDWEDPDTHLHADTDHTQTPTIEGNFSTESTNELLTAVQTGKMDLSHLIPRFMMLVVVSLGSRIVQEWLDNILGQSSIQLLLRCLSQDKVVALSTDQVTN